MKNKAIMVSLAFFALAFALVSVMAHDVATIEQVVVDEVSLSEGAKGNVLAGFVDNTVPVRVLFQAQDDAEDVRVRVYIEGYKSEISETTERFNIVNGSDYIKRFSITLPSTFDLDDDPENLRLIVRISSKGEESIEQTYNIRIQKDSYSLQFLSIESMSEVTVGNVLPLDVVLQNNGYQRLDNVYVRVSIPELGIQQKVYFGDIVSEQDDFEDDLDDVVNKKVYLQIPSSVTPGTYVVEIDAYNYDVAVKAKKNIVISEVDAQVLPSVTTKTIAKGESTTYDLVLVNPSDKIVVYTLTSEVSKGLIVEIAEPVVAVPADSSRTVKVSVKATDSADEGTNVVTVNVNSQSGLVKQVNFNANIDGEEGVSAMVVLTIILAVIFVVLLIVLIVLLTKKPAENEELGETSYY